MYSGSSQHCSALAFLIIHGFSILPSPKQPHNWQMNVFLSKLCPIKFCTRTKRGPKGWMGVGRKKKKSTRIEIWIEPLAEVVVFNSTLFSGTWGGNILSFAVWMTCPPHGHLEVSSRLVLQLVGQRMNLEAIKSGKKFFPLISKQMLHNDQNYKHSYNKTLESRLPAQTCLCMVAKVSVFWPWIIILIYHVCDSM